MNFKFIFMNSYKTSHCQCEKNIIASVKSFHTGNDILHGHEFISWIHIWIHIWFHIWIHIWFHIWFHNNALICYILWGMNSDKDSCHIMNSGPIFRLRIQMVQSSLSDCHWRGDRVGPLPTSLPGQDNAEAALLPRLFGNKVKVTPQGHHR